LQSSADSQSPLRQFLTEFTTMAHRTDGNEAALLENGCHLVKQLIEDSAWLPKDYASPGSSPYASYLLYADPQERFVVTSFAWNREAATPIHDHATWGIVGVLQGCEISQRFEMRDGTLERAQLDTLVPGAVDAFSPSAGDIHAVRNGSSDTTVSIHVYGADLVKWPHSAYTLSGKNPRPILSTPHRNRRPLITPE
jgi:predicted metal-dependent enzyme (double-stranded beta helix superfamily)